MLCTHAHIHTDKECFQRQSEWIYIRILDLLFYVFLNDRETVHFSPLTNISTKSRKDHGTYIDQILRKG